MIFNTLAHTLFVLVVAVPILFIGLTASKIFEPQENQTVAGSLSWGFATICLWTGAGLYLGLPVFASSLLLLAAWVITTIWLFKKATFALRLQNLKLEFLILLLVSLYASFLMFRHAGSGWLEPWGSGDLFYYWNVADYLFFENLNPTTFQKQMVFPLNNIFEHVVSPPFVKWGSMGLISFFKLFGIENSYVVINPLLVVLVFSLIFSTKRLFPDSSLNLRLWPYFAALTSFTYFTYFYTYISQVLGILFLIEGGRRAGDLLSKPSGVRSQLAIAFFFIAGILSFEINLASTVVFLGFLLSYHLLRTKKWSDVWALRYLYACLGIAFIAFGPVIANALKVASNMRPLNGWTWERLPSALDLLGGSTSLTIQLGRVGDLSSYVCLGSLGVIFFYTLYRSWRDQSQVVLAIVLTNLVFLASALKLYAEDVPNASHSVWKTVSMFSLLLSATSFMFLVDLLKKQKIIIQRAVAAAGFLLVLFPLLGQEIAPPWYSKDLIKIVNENSKNGDNLFLYQTALREYYSSSMVPLFKSRASFEQSSYIGEFHPERLRCDGKTVFIWDNKLNRSPAETQKVGTYSLGQPPKLYRQHEQLGFAWRFATSSASSQQYLLQNSPDSQSFQILASSQQPGQQIDLFINGALVGTVTLSTTLARVDIPTPSEAKRKCEKLTFVELRSKVEGPMFNVAEIGWN